MQVAVSYDKSGQITLMFDPTHMRQGKYSISYEPAAGENHRVLEVPQQFHGKPLSEFGHLLRVNTGGANHRLEARH